MSAFKSKEFREKYFQKKYGSGIENLKLRLIEDLKKDNFDQGLSIDLIVLMKKDGFKSISDILNNSNSFIKKDVFEDFIIALKKASRKVLDNDAYVVKDDFFKKSSNKEILNSFKDFVDSLNNNNYSFNISLFNTLSRNLNIDYEISKKDIKESWKNNTNFYLKNTFLDKSKELSDNFNKFVIFNLKENFETFNKAMNKLISKDKYNIRTNSFLEMIVSDLDNKKLLKIEKLNEFLNNINETLEFKKEKFLEKINYNISEFNEFKSNLESNDSITSVEKEKTLLNAEKIFKLHDMQLKNDIKTLDDFISIINNHLNEKNLYLNIN